MINKAVRVPPRDAWGDESTFSRWLAENIDELSSETGLVLSNPRVEDPAGDFSIDFVADAPGGVVITENQLEQSDHRHLGQLLTYVVQ